MSAQDMVFRVDTVLDDLADMVNQMANVDGKLNDVEGAILLLGLMDSKNTGAAATVGLAQVAKANVDSLLNLLFSIRERLTIYRRTIE